MLLTQDTPKTVLTEQSNPISALELYVYVNRPLPHPLLGIDNLVPKRRRKELAGVFAPRSVDLQCVWRRRKKCARQHKCESLYVQRPLEFVVSTTPFPK